MITEIEAKIYRYIYGREAGKVMNMDQNKLMEAINQNIIGKYTQNVALVGSRIIKLFTCFPHTGAPNVSDPVNIALISDLEKFVKMICTSSNN